MKSKKAVEARTGYPHAKGREQRAVGKKEEDPCSLSLVNVGCRWGAQSSEIIACRNTFQIRPTFSDVIISRFGGMDDGNHTNLC